MTHGPLRYATCLLLLVASPVMGETMRIADPGDASQNDRWRFFTDGVMGGVSQGQAQISEGALLLTGDVSTANNGGFVQARLSDVRLPADAEALRLRVRGDGQRYYIFLRTTQTRRPWQFYAASFVAPEAWTEITLPLSDFEPDGRGLSAPLAADEVRSLGLVAYGRDHEARVALDWVDVLTKG